MRSLAQSLLTLAVILVFAVSALAEEKKTVTLDGKMVCALCTLKEKDLKDCQNVVQVTDEKGDVKNYYVVANDAGKEFGHVCKATPTVKVTGTVVEKDGKTWIEPTKIEKLEKS